MCVLMKELQVIKGFFMGPIISLKTMGKTNMCSSLNW